MYCNMVYFEKQSTEEENKSHCRKSQPHFIFIGTGYQIPMPFQFQARYLRLSNLYTRLEKAESCDKSTSA